MSRSRFVSFHFSQFFANGFLRASTRHPILNRIVSSVVLFFFIFSVYFMTRMLVNYFFCNRFTLMSFRNEDEKKNMHRQLSLISNKSNWLTICCVEYLHILNTYTSQWTMRIRIVTFDLIFHSNWVLICLWISFTMSLLLYFIHFFSIVIVL